MLADLLIDNADLVATCAGPGPRRGSAQREISRAAERVGRRTRRADRLRRLRARLPRARSRSTPQARSSTAAGCTVVPGFVDPHTHLVFAGDRRDELRRRLAGATYADIAASGGGIVKTVDATRVASEDELVDGARPAARGDAGVRHDDRGSEERLRPRPRGGTARCCARSARWPPASRSS